MKKLNKIAGIIVLSALGIYACSEGEGSMDVMSDGSGQGGSMARFTISNNHLYIVDQTSLKTFDISNSANPVYTDSVFMGYDIETIFPFQNKLLMGSRNGMYIYDISTPSAPRELSYSSHFYSCDPVVTDGKYAYVTLKNTDRGCGWQNDNLLQIYDVTDFQNPDFIADYSMSSPNGLAVEGNYLFVCDNGLAVYDKSNVNDLNEIEHIYDITTYDVIVKNNNVMVIGDDGLYQYHFNGSSLQYLSKILVSR